MLAKNCSLDLIYIFLCLLWLKKKPPCGGAFTENDGWCFWRRRWLLPPQDYFLSQWRSITQIHNLSLGFHIILFWELLLRNGKISSKSLSWNEWAACIFFKLILYFDSAVISNQVKYHLTANRGNLLQVQHGFYKFTLTSISDNFYLLGLALSHRIFCQWFIICSKKTVR